MIMPSLIGIGELDSKFGLLILIYFQRTIHNMMYNALKSFIEMDPNLFDDCLKEHERLKNVEKDIETERQRRWQAIREMACKKDMLKMSSIVVDEIAAVKGLSENIDELNLGTNNVRDKNGSTGLS